MSSATDQIELALTTAATALECDFPQVEISQLAEQESWRKEINRPIYHIHKWWATRLGSVFRGVTLGALSQPEPIFGSHSTKFTIWLERLCSIHLWEAGQRLVRLLS